jgi:hypothetical protein
VINNVKRANGQIVKDPTFSKKKEENTTQSEQSYTQADGSLH